jgi:predicted lipoprotein with Yx(FWY)xxD motif
MHTSSPRRTQGRRRGAVLAVPALVGAAALGVAACGSPSAASSGSSAYGNAAPSPSKVPAPAASGTALALRQTSLGTILTDGRGFTLYAFDADKGTMANCSGTCATAWPPDTAMGTDPQVGSGVTQSLVTGDSAPGTTHGDGSTAFGARWDALTATGQDATGG